jgi:hypothetical protein
MPSREQRKVDSDIYLRERRGRYAQQQGETVLVSIRRAARVLAWILVILHRLGYKAQQRLSLRDPVLEPSRDHSAPRDCVRGSTLSSTPGYLSLSPLVAQDWPYPLVCSHLAGVGGMGSSLAWWQEHGTVSHCERSRRDPMLFAVSQKGHWPGCMTFDVNLIAEDPWRCCSARLRI